MHLRLFLFLTAWGMTGMVPASASAEENKEAIPPGSDPFVRVNVSKSAVSFEIPESWVSEVKEGTLLFHEPVSPGGAGPEATLSLQLIDNSQGASTLPEQVAKLKTELKGLSGVEYLADKEEGFAGQPGHLILGTFLSKGGGKTGMVWCLFSRSTYFYWLGMTFPPEKWSNGYAVVMDRVNSGFQFTPLHDEAIRATEEVVGGFMRDIRSGKWDEAFARTSETFRRNTPRPNFESFVKEQAAFSSFQSFRFLDNTGTSEQRQLCVELGGVGGKGIPMIFVGLDRVGQTGFLVSSFYLTLGHRVGDVGTASERPGFAKLVDKKAGFSGSFPESWIVLPEALSNGYRIVFRRPGGGLVRQTEAIIVTIGPGDMTPAQALESYVAGFSGRPGYQRAKTENSRLGGRPAAGSSFTLEQEDDRGLHHTVNLVTTVKSAKNSIAAIHVMVETEDFEKRFEDLVRPVFEDFRFVE
ncbi:MAG: hypothetical protein IT576_21630 [Verrucomicrobiales bacterium]|nr:hypothetical protein [Verrucomicrobiales bacterium]